MEIHAEAESDDRGLQQKFGEFLAVDMERVGDGEAIEQATKQSEGWRDHAARGQDESDKK
jgi:hypothetical protein